MNKTTQHPDDFASAFENAFARLQIRVETACAAEVAWQAKVSAAIRAALDFAAANPNAACVLTVQALVERPDGAERYLRLIAHFSAQLRADAPRDDRRPASVEEALIGGIAMIVADHLRCGRLDRLPAELTPELVKFVLRAYGC